MRPVFAAEIKLTADQKRRKRGKAQKSIVYFENKHFWKSERPKTSDLKNQVDLLATP